MRDGRWKVLARLNGGTFPKLQNVTTQWLAKIQRAQLTDFEIYNMTSDIGESTNLFASDSSTAGRLSKKLDTLYRELVSNSHVWTPGTADSRNLRGAAN